MNCHNKIIRERGRGTISASEHGQMMKRIILQKTNKEFYGWFNVRSTWRNESNLSIRDDDEDNPSVNE